MGFRANLVQPQKFLFESLEKDERNLLKSDEEIHFHLIEIENSEKSSQEKRTPIFSDKLISVQNLLKFTYPPYFDLMKSPLLTNGEKIEIWDNDVFYRISYKEEKNHHSFYIQNLGDDYLAVYLEYENGETGMYYRTQSGEDLSPITSENKSEYAFLQEQWERFLPRWEEIVYQMQTYNDTVNKERFFEILNSEKIAEVYQNFQNIQKSTYVNVRGGNYFAMLKRNPPYRHRISIAKHSGFDGDDNELYAFYHFEWDEALGRVILLTQDGNGEQFSPYEIDFSQTHLYHTATKLFANIEEMLWI